MKELRIGVSGWSYAGWRGAFYPAALPRKKELGYISRELDSVEINGSFYALQRPATYQRWYDETPARFRFAVKGSRFITHMKKLKEAERPLANFFASGVLALGEKLGPILWQLPPNLHFDEERVARFLALLPTDTPTAARLARRHDERLSGRSFLSVRAEQPLRHAFEVRHESYLTPAFIHLLRHHQAALVFADTAGRFPYAEEVTANFIYLRLHGAEQLYASGYGDDELAWWAARIRRWRAGGEPADARRITHDVPPGRGGRAVYVYFDNDALAHAPHDAMRLAALFGAEGTRHAA